MRSDTTDALMLVMDYLHATADVSAAERLVLYSLAARINRSRGDWHVWPTLPRIAGESGISADTARRALRSLVGRGILSVARAGLGRGNPTVYRLEKVAICDLLGGAKRSQPWPIKGRKSDPPVQVQPEVLRTGSTDIPSVEGDAVALASLWNLYVTAPIPKVRLPLSSDRIRRYGRAWAALAVEDWAALIVYLNGQDWCRAPGTGDHGSWTATLDWLTSKPAVWQRQLEKAQTAAVRSGPKSRAEAYRQTTDRNAQAVGILPTFTIGGRVDDDEAREN